MKNKENFNISGRLGSRNDRPGPVTQKHKSNYGKDRLGILSDEEPGDNDSIVIPNSNTSELPTQEGRKSVIPFVHEASQKTQSQIVQGPQRNTSRFGVFIDWKSFIVNFAESLMQDRQKLMSACTIAAFVLIAMISFIWIVSDGATSPQTLSAADLIVNINENVKGSDVSGETAVESLQGDNDLAQLTLLADNPRPVENKTDPGPLSEEEDVQSEIAANLQNKPELEEIELVKPDEKEYLPQNKVPLPPKKQPKQQAPKPEYKERPIKYRPCPAGLKLSGIIRQPGYIKANINGKFVGVGQRIKGAKVIEIKEFSVEMELDGERFLLGFGPSITSSGSSNHKTDTSQQQEGSEHEKEGQPE